MPWFYNDHSGALTEQNGVSEAAYIVALHSGTGWHEYPTEQAALADIQRHGWPAPFNAPAGSINPREIKTGAGNALGQVPGTLGGFLGTVASRQTWIRVVEVGIGAMLVIVAIVKLTEGTKLESAGKTVGKVAPFLL